jgi:hypothetical protein
MGVNTRKQLVAALALSLAANVRAGDLHYEFGGVDARLSAIVTTGATWRMQGRDNNLIGKLNVQGQQDLCTADDCMSLQGDAKPNQRLVQAEGSYGGGNLDNGNLNYDRYEIVGAATRIAPEIGLAYGDWKARVKAILFYDPVNDRFDESHSNTRFQSSSTRRPRNISRQFARGVKLREAYVSTTVPIGERNFSLAVGNQQITWGESVLTPFNTLNTVNPPDAVLAHMPGFELKDLYQPVTAITFGGDVVEGISADVFYQALWQPAIADPAGSFFSANDFVGGGKYLTLGLGQFAEDPDRQFRPAGLSKTLSSSSRTLNVLPDDYAAPRNGGQYGTQLKYFAPNLLGGTEFGAYYANYHSRLPYISAISSNPSCTRDAINNTFAAAFVACKGFNGVVNPVGGREPVPVDTAQIFLDYPEDIHLMGLSFNANVGGWSLAGEYAYRPNMPLQVHATDVIFAAISPGFPNEDIGVPANTAALGVTAPFTIPGHRSAVPDFLSGYRGISEYGPNQVIHGYERFKVGQFALTGIRLFGASDNPIGADQIQLLAEISGTQIFDLPNLSELQLEGTGNRSHYSPGADGTGTPDGKPDPRHVNPTQQRSGAATAFSWGYRIAVRSQYSHAIGNVSLYPTILLFHDLGGISPATIDNYVKDRITANFQLDAELSQALAAGIQYQWLTGAGRNNLRKDRDSLSVHLRYSF